MLKIMDSTDMTTSFTFRLLSRMILIPSHSGRALVTPHRRNAYNHPLNKTAASFCSAVNSG
ncbi:MAG: hypothetical protein ACOX6U_08060 [Oscillospiraceae bacterium]